MTCWIACLTTYPKKEKLTLRCESWYPFQAYKIENFNQGQAWLGSAKKSHGIPNLMLGRAYVRAQLRTVHTSLWSWCLYVLVFQPHMYKRMRQLQPPHKSNLLSPSIFFPKILRQ